MINDSDPDLDYFDGDNEDGYRPIQEIQSYELENGLASLSFFASDPYLRMQATNITVVDQFLNQCEKETLQLLIDQERTPIPEAIFLNAQSQMWIFAIYEILRTWRQRALDMIKWQKNGAILQMIENFSRHKSTRDIGIMHRLEVLQAVHDDPSFIDVLHKDLKRLHFTFSELEFLRITLAKHEVRGQKNSFAVAPGYGRINSSCGSLDYQMDAGSYVIGFINRRDIADQIRELPEKEAPNDAKIAEFDRFMAGKVDTTMLPDDGDF